MKNTQLYLLILLMSPMLQLPRVAISQQWPGIADSLYSETLKEQRRIQVIVPKNYKPESGHKYEVLYVLDGEWYMEQIPFIYNFVASSGYAPQNIFVLIPNTYVDNVNLRDRDFSPTRMDNIPALGGADNFHLFLKTELIPYVEKKYPANGRRSLVGSSFSGLFAVYAFVKEPQLFQSFVASDPNLNWDHNYVSKLASKKLPEYSHVNATLYIAGLTRTFAVMGIASMDSALRAHAPESIRWQCVPYANETHYSVQHKAFYDGFRFSHLGYSARPPEFHPMNGLLEEDKPIKLFLLSDNASLRYTTDGSEPAMASPVFSREEHAVVPGPSTLKIKSFANRPDYSYVLGGNFSSGTAVSAGKVSKKSKAGLKYYVFDEDWTSLPSLDKNMKPVKTGIVDDKFNINSIKGERNSAYLVEGFIEIPEDAYYVFYANSENGSKVMIADKMLIQLDGVQRNAASFVVPLRKGLYPLRLEFLRKKDGGDIHFFIRRTKADNDRWWQTEFYKL